jgi:hypothetical protein
MTGEQRTLFTKAQRMLRTAHVSLDDGDPESAINRAYYAAYYAATAALLSVGETPKTHTGTHNRFYGHFVQSGSIASEIGATLKEAFNLRQRADYEAVSIFDEAAATDLIVDVERFVEAVEAMLGTGR